MKIQNWKSALAILAVTASLTACNNTNNNQSTTDSTSNAADSSSTTLAVNPLAHSKEFPGATLNIASITSEKVGTDSAKVTVKYEVKNFELTAQTEHEHHMANSHDGQHIHFILNNTPYVALYKPEHSTTVPVNSEHYLMSFLSRSFHESIKTADASKLVKFKIDADGKVIQEATPTSPAIFYSRPKGDYKGADTKNILLDFFVSNTTLAADGNKILANINGQDFTLDQWIPYEITGLPLGENVIKISLVDKDGKAVTGEHTTVERKINLTAE